MAKFNDRDDNSSYVPVVTNLPLLDRHLSIAASNEERKVVLRMNDGKGHALTAADEVDKIIATLTKARDLAFAA